MKMSSNRPYMIRAFYDWIVDNQCTPYLVVDATIEGTDVPMQFVQDGQIILNVNPGAVVGFNIGPYTVEFNARFGGKPFHVRVPLAAVLAIYARENGEGMVFPELSDDELMDLAEGLEQGEEPVAERPVEPEAETKPKRPNHLKVIK